MPDTDQAFLKLLADIEAMAAEHEGRWRRVGERRQAWPELSEKIKLLFSKVAEATTKQDVKGCCGLAVRSKKDSVRLAFASRSTGITVRSKSEERIISENGAQLLVVCNELGEVHFVHFPFYVEDEEQPDGELVAVLEPEAVNETVLLAQIRSFYEWALTTSNVSRSTSGVGTR